MKQLRKYHGVDIVSRNSGRVYEKLPVPLVTLCEALDNQEIVADEGFTEIFSRDADIVPLLNSIDEGKPVAGNTPAASLWCALKIFLDCLPLPLLPFKALQDLLE